MSCAPDADYTLDMARSEADDIRKAAARLADALTDINNILGEIPEIKAIVASVESDRATYAGLARH